MKFLLIFIAFLYTSTSAEGILCYDCVYCNDPFEPNSEYVRSCNGIICSKTTRYYQNENKTVVLARSCESNVTLGIPTTYWKKYYCNTDFCNGTSSPLIAASIFIFTISIQLFISWYEIVWKKCLKTLFYICFQKIIERKF